jgi:hypothetical protein
MEKIDYDTIFEFIREKNEKEKLVGYEEWDYAQAVTEHLIATYGEEEEPEDEEEPEPEYAPKKPEKPKKKKAVVQILTALTENRPVKFEWNKDNPLRISGNLQDKGTYWYLLAPRIEEGDE